MLKNSNIEYGMIAKVFHWGNAIFILPALFIGLWFAWSDLETDFGWEQFESLINWHVGFGITAFILMLVRVFWRLRNVTPSMYNGVTTTQAKTALFVHKLLYVTALLTPLTGWLGSSLEGHSLYYFSVIEIPPFLGVYPTISSIMTELHFYISWGFSILLLTHLLGVIYHLLYLKHNILKRML